MRAGGRPISSPFSETSPRAWRQSAVSPKRVRRPRGGSQEGQPGALFLAQDGRDPAQTDRPLGRVRRQEIAVMFIDIVGFTAISEMLTPERVVALVRSFYRRMSKVIFPRRLDRKVRWRCTHGAVRCSRPGQARCDERLIGRPWHDGRTGSLECQRVGSGREAIDAGISVHFGTAVLGDIGTHDR